MARIFGNFTKRLLWSESFCSRMKYGTRRTPLFLLTPFVVMDRLNPGIILIWDQICEQRAVMWTDVFLFPGVKACEQRGLWWSVLFSSSLWVLFIKLKISTTAGSFVLFLCLIRSGNLLMPAVPHVKPISATLDLRRSVFSPSSSWDGRSARQLGRSRGSGARSGHQAMNRQHRSHTLRAE